MCKKQPCIGTPKDILKIIMAGHADKLAQSTWMVGLVSGEINRPIKMVQPLALENGHCAFLDENDLCTLHDLDLKPTEGRLSHHDDFKNFSGTFRDTINFKTALSWVDENGVNDPILSLINAKTSKPEV
jgi:hypothetical protein